jgi:hypothetical protein
MGELDMKQEIRFSTDTFIDGLAVKVKCSACNEILDLGNALGSAELQEQKLANAVGAHLHLKHSEEFTEAEKRFSDAPLLAR